MKITNTTYETMFSAVKSVIESVGVEKVRLAFIKNPVATMWSIWNRASDDLKYDDSHPRYKTVKRIIPYTGFYIYAVDNTINDNHIETALKKIFKDI